MMTLDLIRGRIPACGATRFLALGLISFVTACSPSITSENPDERLEALRHIADQSALGEIAKGDKNQRVAHAAAERLVDQNVIADVLVKRAFNQRDTSMLLDKLTDPASLLHVVMNSDRDTICELAVKKITDQSALADIVLAPGGTKGLNDEIRILAIAGLRDQKALEMRAMGKFFAFSKAAIVNLTDVRALFRVTANHPDPMIAMEAMAKLIRSPGLEEYRKQGIGGTEASLELMAHASQWCEAVPDEHRTRICSEVIKKVITFHREKTTLEKVGNIRDIRVIWRELSKQYLATSGRVGLETIGGESVEVHITFSGLTAKLDWSTNFPGEIDRRRHNIGTFIPAPVTNTEIFHAVRAATEELRAKDEFRAR
jgi:hypothetical protein